jgi:uncharacterized membrane protein
MRQLWVACTAALILFAVAGPARAGLEFCNETRDTQSVSIGYQGDEDWISEGWWNIEPGDCAMALGGDLELQYYYYRAEVDAGDFEGEGYYFCTSPQAYEITGDTDCARRGYDREEFREIDTGPSATHFTVNLVDPGPVSGADGGLIFCNETDYIQSVSIGYNENGEWISEGWWNVDPGECQTPLAGALQQRYYYYRAEVDAGDFDGEGYFFCTSPEAYTIVGEGRCAMRGYDSEDFAEIDTGPTTTEYTVTLIDPDAGPAPDIVPKPKPAPDASPRPTPETGPPSADLGDDIPVPGGGDGSTPEFPTFERKEAPRPGQ